MPHESPATTNDAVGRQYSLWQRVQFTLVSWIVSAVIAAIGFTLRITFSAEEDSVASVDDIYPGIFPFWHRCVLPAAWIFRRRNLAVMTSQSRDGEFIARIIEHFGFVPVRGSSSRGGIRALLELRKLVTEGGGVAFTIDGPRGPRNVAKRGPIALARETGVAIVPFYIALDRAWALNTWDGLSFLGAEAQQSRGNPDVRRCTTQQDQEMSMKKLRNFLKAAEIAAGTGMFLLEQSNRYAPRMRSRMNDSMDDLKDRAKDAYDVIADRVSGITRRQDDHSGLWNVVRFAAGVGIGIGIGMLMAPDTGEQTRSRLADKAQEIGDNVKQKFNQEAKRYQREGLQATGTGD